MLVDAIRTLNLQPTGHIPHWEDVALPDLERAVTKLEPRLEPVRARLELCKQLNISVLEELPVEDENAPMASTKQDQDKGHRVRWAAGESWSWVHGSGFSEPEDVWKFDPVKSFLENDYPEILEDIAEIQPFIRRPVAEMARILEHRYQETARLAGDVCLVPMGFYRTLIMWPLMLFGWDLFLRGIGEYPDRFGQLMQRFSIVTEKVLRSYALTSAPVFLSHDDLCMAKGPICNPEWYRKYVYPCYERLWAILREKGKKIVFVSDGNMDLIADDIFACGADGILIEPYTDLRKMVTGYGNSKVIIGNIDTRIITYGTKDDIEQEVLRCAELGRRCPGFFFMVSNHLTWNTPIDNILHYFQMTKKHGSR